MVCSYQRSILRVVSSHQAMAQMVVPYCTIPLLLVLLTGKISFCVTNRVPKWQFLQSLISPVATGSLCVGATHLKAKGGFEALRLAQGSDLLTQMKDFSDGADPFVICGDFNAVPVCCAYRSNVVGGSF